MKATRTPLSSLLLALFVLTGCTENLMTAGEDTPHSPIDTRTSKVRHAHLFDRAAAPQQASKGEPMTGLVLQLLDGVDRQALLAQYQLTSRYFYNGVFYGLAADVETSLLDEVLAKMEQDPDIVWVEPNFYTESPAFTSTPGTFNGKLPWGIERVGATESFTESGDGTDDLPEVHLFLLDTGIENTDVEITEEQFFGDSNNTSDFYGHGTHMAGTAAALDNSVGLVGVAPKAQIHNLKATNDAGLAGMADMLAALDYVILYKAKLPSQGMVISLSCSADVGTTAYTALDDAIETAVAAGITVVVGAGNQGIDAATVSPAHAAGAITVGAYDVNDDFAAFSNYGASVDLLAPGVDILSTAPTSSVKGAAYARSSGTSMAAAHVAGAAALYLAYFPTASPEEVRKVLLSYAQATVFGTPAATTDKTVWVGSGFPMASTTADDEDDV